MPHVLRRNRARWPRRLHAVIAMLFIVGALAPRSGTADVVFDPWNFAQNVVSAIQSITEVAQQVQQLANETTQIANQVQQLQDMANQAASITSPTWGEVQVSIAALANAVQIGRAIAYNLPDIQARFQAQFPGYVPPTDWNTELQQASQSTLDTLNATLYFPPDLTPATSTACKRPSLHCATRATAPPAATSSSRLRTRSPASRSRR